MKANADSLVQAARDAEVATACPNVTAVIEAMVARGRLRSGELGVAVRHDGDDVLWFLLAGDKDALADMSELARAFVGPTNARRRRATAHLVTGDPFSDAIHAVAPGGAFVLLSPAQHAQRCATAISLMLDVAQRRPPNLTTSTRQVGAVLRDFEDAVSREDPAAAQVALDEAWSTGRMSLVNRSFLQTRVLACGRQWAAVIDHAKRHRLADLDLPRSVEHDLVRAIYFDALADPLGIGGPGAAVEAFSDQVELVLGDVFRDPWAAASAEARRAWAIRFAATDRAFPSAVLADLLSKAEFGELSVLEEIAALARFDAPPTSDTARQLLSVHEDAAAWALAEKGGGLGGSVRAGVLVQAADHLGDPNRLAVAAKAVLGAADPSGVVAPGRLVAEVVSAQQHRIVAGWEDWIRQLYADPSWAAAVPSMETGADAWTESLRRNERSLDELADVVEVLSGEHAFRLAFPRLVRALIPGEPTRVEVARARTPLLLALLRSAANDPQSGVADLDAAADITSAVLDGGVNERSYREVTECLATLWMRSAGSPRLWRWAVDATRILLTHQSPSPDDRDAAVGKIVSPIAQQAPRSRRVMAREVVVELVELLDGSSAAAMLRDFIEPAEDETGIGEFDHLAGKSVLLHTLVPSVGERATNYLQALEWNVRVTVDNSHDGSVRLRELARNADFVVIASRASKHAASDFIRANMTGELCWASGKGWSSLVDALRVSPRLA